MFCVSCVEFKTSLRHPCGDFGKEKQEQLGIQVYSSKAKSVLEIQTLELSKIEITNVDEITWRSESAEDRIKDRAL